MKIKYRELKDYKYELTENFSYPVEIDTLIDYTKSNLGLHLYVSITNNGFLKVRSGYCWDGPSGISFDTKNFMRGSLVHDAMYQLIRQRVLPESYREYADQLLKKICIEDGMSKFRAEYVYRAVRLFGQSSARPQPEKENQDIILEAP
jgi:hypothetical protein